MVGAPMTEPSHYFLLGCTVVLGCMLLGSLGASIVESSRGEISVDKVVIRELPFLLYLWALSFTLVSGHFTGPWILGWSAFCLASGFIGVHRIFRYSIKREARQRAAMLAGLQQATQKIEGIQLQIMSQQERAKYLKVQQSPPRRSRYRREPVI